VLGGRGREGVVVMRGDGCHSYLGNAAPIIFLMKSVKSNEVNTRSVIESQFKFHNVIQRKKHWKKRNFIVSLTICVLAFLLKEITASYKTDFWRKILRIILSEFYV
jgi:preprotein translocase subunit Sec63